MTKKENLIEEIITNARRDRERLELVANSLVKKYEEIRNDKELTEELRETGLDAETAAAFSEEISKLSDSLTKVNQQLVELVKVESRRINPDDQPRLKKDDVDKVYDEIQPQEVN